MYSKQIRSLKNTTNEYELTPLVESTEKPVPRICRIPTRLKESAGEDSRQVLTEADETIKGPNDNSQLRQASSDNNIKVGKLEESHPRFGPLYSVDQPSVQAIKDRAWDHVTKKSSAVEPDKVREIYSRAISKVEKEAKETYADKVSAGTGSNFRWMMIKDGCFFLQLALLILGCSEQLGYPSNDPIFGKKHNKKDFKKWIEAMFYVGNQIPLVVLRELMKQEFFQEVIMKRKWDPTPSGLCRKVLYEVLVLPAVKIDQGPSLIERIILMGRGNHQVDQQQPSDLLHGLRDLVIGPPPQGLQSSEYEADEIIDLEANEEEIIGDYETIFPSGINNNDEGTSPGDRIRLLLNAIGLPSAIDDGRTRIYPCATELKRGGIHIKKLKSEGAINIHFKSYYLWAYLYLPAFPVDDNMETIFRNLKTYEACQQLKKNRLEISSYLRVMSDIIQTTKDAKLLEKQGIVQGNSNDVEKLSGILRRLSSQDIRLTNEFSIVRRQIRDYSSPLIHYKGVINLVVFLTLLQTLFALLAYFRPPK